MSNTQPQADDLRVHAEFLRGLARMLLNSPDLADDAVQETMLIAWRKRPEGPHPRGWMAGTLRNVARNVRRAGRRRQRYEDAAPSRESLTPEAIRKREHTRRQLLDVVMGLPDQQRDAIMLRFDRGWPPRRIATELGVPVHTVHNRIRAGLARCRRDLKAQLGSATQKNEGWRRALGALIPTLPLPAASTLTLGGLAMSKALAIVASAAALLILGYFALRTAPDNPTPSDVATNESDTVESAMPESTTAPVLEGQPSSVDADPTEPPPGSTPRLHGRIVDEATGVGVEGAEVLAFDYLTFNTLSAHTGPGGVFAFPSTERSASAYHLRVKAPEYPLAARSRVAARAEGHTIALKGPCYIHGIVTAPSGVSQTGLTVQARPRHTAAAEEDHRLPLIEAALPPALREQPRVAVDPDTGAFRLGPLPAGEHALELRRDGIPPQLVTPDDGRPSWESGFEVAAGEDLNVGTLHLHATRALLVHVIDGVTEKTITRAEFGSFVPLHKGAERTPLEPLGITPEGYFRVPALVTEKGYVAFSVDVSAAGYAPVDASFSGSLVPKVHLVRLFRAASLTLDLQPLLNQPSHGLILVRTSSGEDLVTAQATSIPGTTNFETLPPGVALEILVLGPDARSLLHVLAIRLKPGATEHRTLGDSEAPSVFGSAKIQGTPRSNVLIALDDSSGRRTRVFTGPDGHFRFDAVPPGPAVLIMNFGENTAMVHHHGVVPEGGSLDLSVDLTIPIVAQVHVGGEKPEGTRYTLPDIAFHPETETASRIIVSARVTSDGDVRTWLPGPGTYRVASDSRDYVAVRKNTITVAQPAEGKTQDPILVELANDPANGTIAIHVVDADTGETVAETSCSFRSLGDTGYTTEDEPGRLALSGLRFGTYHLAILAPTYAGKRVKAAVTPGNTAPGLTVRLRKSNAARVVSFVTGSPAQTAGLEINDLILKYAGTDTPNLRALKRALGESGSASHVDLVVHRGARELTISVRAGRLGIEAENATRNP